jgi:hypothetical protein
MYKIYKYKNIFRHHIYLKCKIIRQNICCCIVYGHGDIVRVIDPELGKLERENVAHLEHGISLNSPALNGGVLGTTSTLTRRRGLTRRESNPGNINLKIDLLPILNFFKLAKDLFWK